jgi:GNAT superfamily N-acetyltransferase
MISMDKKILEKYKAFHLQGFISANKAGWPMLQENLKDFPFPVNYIDPANYRGWEFTQEMILLNEKAYGKGMAAPAWTFANFGTIGAGITGGFLSSGQPISKFSMVGNVWDPDIAHEWTLLVEPSYQGKNIASLSLAFALQCVKTKKYHTFIAQTHNNSLHVYLKFPYPLQIMAYGFVHTRKNSLLLKVPIPQNPFETILQSEVKKFEWSEFPNVEIHLPSKGIFWLNANNHQLFLDINEKIIMGSAFFLKGRLERDEKIYLLIERES